MKKICFFLLLLATSYNCICQDFIVKKDNTEIQAKVQEIIGDLIKYKDFDNLDGPIKNISIADIKFILYANGKKEYFGTSVTKPLDIAPALDAIVKTDRTEIKCKIIEITVDAVKYKNTLQVDEPIQSISKTNVFYILYANGKKEYVDAGIIKTVSTQSLTSRNPDIIIKANKTEVVCKIIDITDFEMKYKIIEADDATISTISKIDIAAIKFAKDSKFNLTKPLIKTGDALADSVSNLPDTILQKDNTKILCKIVDKTGIAIAYKKMEIADETTYYINQSNVASLIYAGGVRINIIAPKPYQVSTIDTTSANIQTTTTASPPTIIEKQTSVVAATILPDEVVKTDKSVLKVKVLDVSADEVRYKKMENIDGPTYILKIVDLFMITYANGKTFYPETTAPKNTTTSTNTQTPNIIDQADVLIKKDKTELKVKIYDIEENEVRYKKFDMQDGPFYLIKKSNILMIRYANGKIENFTN